MGKMIGKTSCFIELGPRKRKRRMERERRGDERERERNRRGSEVIDKGRSYEKENKVKKRRHTLVLVQEMTNPPWAPPSSTLTHTLT